MFSVTVYREIILYTCNRCYPAHPGSKTDVILELFYNFVLQSFLLGSSALFLWAMERCSKVLFTSLLLVGALSSTSYAYPNSTSCEDFSDKCALVVEAAAYGLADMMCNTEEDGEKLAHFCPVTCDICMGKSRYLKHDLYFSSLGLETRQF